MQANSNEPGDRPVFENHIEQYNDMQDLKALEGKSLAELREIAKALGIKTIARSVRILYFPIILFSFSCIFVVVFAIFSKICIDKTCEIL